MLVIATIVLLVLMVVSWHGLIRWAIHHLLLLVVFLVWVHVLMWVDSCWLCWWVKLVILLFIVMLLVVLLRLSVK